LFTVGRSVVEKTKRRLARKAPDWLLIVMVDYPKLNNVLVPGLLT